MKALTPCLETLPTSVSLLHKALRREKLLGSDYLYSSPEECAPPWAHNSALSPTLPRGVGKRPVLFLESQADALSRVCLDGHAQLGRLLPEVPALAPLIIIRLEEV